MNERRSKRTDIIGIVTFGFFLLLVGTIFVITPNLSDRVSDFLGDFEPRQVAPNWMLPAPQHHHPVLYTAIFQFCLVFAVFQIFVLGVRFVLSDPIGRKAGTLSSIVFWFGASWIVSLLIEKTIEWFRFVGLLIALIGVVIIIRNLIVLVGQSIRRRSLGPI